MAKKKQEVKINHIHVGILSVAAILLSAAFFLQTLSLSEAKNNEDKGFDKYGYNYNARTFNGLADGVDKNLDGMVWGDPTYANDRLKMTWSKAWDLAKFEGQAWNCSAWTDNVWNGKTPDGSNETWQYKIVWVGPEGEDSACWREGGYSIWGDFEVVFSHGTVANEHFWDAHANPPGYGGF